MSCDTCARIVCANDALKADLARNRSALTDASASNRALKRDLSGVASRAREDEARKGKAALEDLRKR